MSSFASPSSSPDEASESTAVDPRAPGYVASLLTDADNATSDDPQLWTSGNEFVPVEPASLAETGLSELDIASLILKQLHTLSARSGRDIAAHLRLPFRLVQEIMTSLKTQLLVAYRSDAIGGDYEYELTPNGLEKAIGFMNLCTYCGAAPVGLEEYRHAVEAQKISSKIPSPQDLARAYRDMLLSPAMVAQIGQAISAGTSLFLYGEPGNGKTSIAERAMSVLGDFVWIPRSIAVCGQVIRVFDTNCHIEAPVSNPDRCRFDGRWVRIKRPTVVVGGELDADHLLPTTNPVSGISEAPVQLKANCGCLVIDDFGRQKIGATELLNRWIIPLEKGHDNLHLPSGLNVQVPFEQLLVFSTNLKPSSLCDEAFLRRIRYKIEVPSPNEKQFKRLFLQRAERYEMPCQEGIVDYLLETHFRTKNRQLRFCHAEDLLQQVKDFCRFHNVEPMIDRNRIDFAAMNYFAGL